MWSWGLNWGYIYARLTHDVTLLCYAALLMALSNSWCYRENNLGAAKVKGRKGDVRSGEVGHICKQTIASLRNTTDNSILIIVSQRRGKMHLTMQSVKGNKEVHLL